MGRGDYFVGEPWDAPSPCTTHFPSCTLPPAPCTLFWAASIQQKTPLELSLWRPKTNKPSKASGHFGNSSRQTLFFTVGFVAVNGANLGCFVKFGEAFAKQFCGFLLVALADFSIQIDLAGVDTGLAHPVDKAFLDIASKTFGC